MNVKTALVLALISSNGIELLSGRKFSLSSPGFFIYTFLLIITYLYILHQLLYTNMATPII